MRYLGLAIFMIGIFALRNLAFNKGRQPADNPMAPYQWRARWVSLIGFGIVPLLGMYVLFLDYSNNRPFDVPKFVNFLFIISLIVLPTIIYPLLWSEGVDQDKFWRKAPLFNKSVSFAEVTGFKDDQSGLTLVSPNAKIRVIRERGDFALVNVRLLQEMSQRRLDLPGNVPSGAPDWDVHAAQWRASLASEVLSSHPEFFAAQPDQAHYLRELAGLDPTPEVPKG